MKEKHESQIRKSRRRLDEQQMLKDTLEVVTNPHGRRFIKRIFRFCMMYTTPYTGSQESTFFNLGMQSVAHWLLADMQKLKDVDAFDTALLFDILLDVDTATVATAVEKPEGSKKTAIGGEYGYEYDFNWD